MTKLRNIVGGSLFLVTSVALGLVSWYGFHEYHTSKYLNEMVVEMKPNIINEYGQKKYEKLFDTVKEERNSDGSSATMFGLASLVFAGFGISCIRKKE